MRILSKSQYMAYKTCPKQLWYLRYEKDKYIESPDAQQHINDGILVGNYAKAYFPNAVDVTTLKSDGNLDFNAMIGKTQELLQEGGHVIAEASFSVAGLFCSVDLLVPVAGGYEIYEVKAVTKADKTHVIDAAFQQYVLTKAGINIIGVHIMHLNGAYRRHGDIDVKRLLIAEKVETEKNFLKTLLDLPNDLADINTLLSNNSEPVYPRSSSCSDCPFKEYCHRNIPFPTVLDVQGSTALRRYDLYNKGVRTFQDVLNSGKKLSAFQLTQIDCYLNNKETHIDKKGLKAFLSSLRYPIYHLDFETIMMAVPPCDDSWPYEQIPTQYSLHIEHSDGTLEHKEFLGDSMDPRRAIAESLCRDIPKQACLMAFNINFEKSRLLELASLFPDLANHLESLAENLIDLADPFSQAFYYHKDMWNRYSIKAVLPALYPNDSELDYHALPVVHNGSEAMNIYPIMISSPKEEADKIRDGLLKYCCLDTLAMVKILKRIKEVVS